MFLAIYLLLVILIQFIVNASIITTTCGGNIGENMGAAGLFTFIPWILIFGVLLLILIAYPGFKSAFSDVIGYYYVSNSATKILGQLLISPEIQETIDKSQISADEKHNMETTAQAIIKIFGNNAILINQIVPSNFVNYWNILTPLKNTAYKDETKEDTQKIKKELFELVVKRDNIGEAMWYIYTGLLVTSVVQLKLTTRGCNSNPKTMEDNYQKFLKEEKQSKINIDKTKTTYKL